MKLWSFSHNVMGMDVYAFLSLIVLIVMIIVGVWFFFAQRRRDEKHDEELSQIRAELAEVRDLDEGEGELA